MNILQKEKDGIFVVMAGADITHTIHEAIKLSNQENRPISFEFNEVVVTITSNSRPELIYRDWLRAFYGYIPKKVGPEPAPELTQEEKANDARIEAQREARRQKARAEYEAQEKARRVAYEAQEKARRVAVEKKLRLKPKMELADKAAWMLTVANNPEPYGRAVINYAERWARLMQIEISNGRSIEEVAEATSQEADLEGITGFQFACAASILTKVWTHGQQLNSWRHKTNG